MFIHSLKAWMSHYSHIDSVCLLDEQVGQDVVAELTKALEKQGLDMRVSALVG